MNKTIILTALTVAISATTNAAVLWSINPNTHNSTSAPSNTTVDTTLATNVTGTDGSGYGGSGSTGELNAFDVNTGNDGLDFIRHSSSASLTTVADFTEGFTEFTISAALGFELNLSTLTFNSAQGGSSETRGFEIYDATEGTPTIANLLLDVDDETGTRAAPTARSIDLSGAAFQGINTVTFRYYALTTNTDQRTIEFNSMALNGDVVAVPEPSSAALLGLGGLALILRRRK